MAVDRRTDAEESSMKVRIPPTEWKYNLKRDRVEHLDATPDGDELRELVITEIGMNLELAGFCWQSSKSMKGCFRVKVSIPCTAPTYDWLFNGPSGYRAYYYSSENEGEAFNQLLVAGLVSVLIPASRWREIDLSIDGLGERSLHGPWSKLGFDDAAFSDSPPRELLASRWDRRSGGCDLRGLRAPRPPQPELQFSGTWIDRATRGCQLDKSKADRPCDIWSTGYA
jgi:hypothetical protein